MRRPASLAALVALAFGALAFVAGCKDAPTRWDDAAASSARTPAASPSAKPEDMPAPGGALNKFFPKEEAGESRVFTQEKTGYAEAKLKKDGKELATLSVSDTRNDPDAKGKFTGAADSLEGSPLVTVGKNQSAVLVKDRWQVKVSSTTLDADARKSILQRFDRNGLSQL